MLKSVADILVLTMVAGNVPATEVPAEYETTPIISENTTTEQQQEEPFIIIEEPELVPAEPVEEQKPKEINFDYDIASYTTKYTGADSNNRNYNMHLASDSINGIILQIGRAHV